MRQLVLNFLHMSGEFSFSESEFIDLKLYSEFAVIVSNGTAV